MELQENIRRIKSMMGVITENKKDEVIKKLIDDVGIDMSIKLLGGGELIDRYLSYEDKLEYIGNKLIKFGNLNLGLGLLPPIPIKEDNKEVSQIEYLAKTYAVFNKYVKVGSAKLHDMVYRLNYEDLPTDIIDKIFRYIVSIK